ncbi:MAG: DM13 domain-containing protein [Bacteroidota bacterium]
MRFLLALCFAGLLFFSCKKDYASATPVQDNIDTATAVEKYDGSFMSGAYGSVSGTAKIYDDNGVYQVALINITVSNGPDLHVYLSKEEQPIHFIDLGKLKSTSGNQLYPILIIPDFSQYRYVLIHCQKYNHLFGSAMVAP